MSTSIDTQTFIADYFQPLLEALAAGESVIAVKGQNGPYEYERVNETSENSGVYSLEFVTERIQFELYGELPLSGNNIEKWERIKSIFIK